MSRRPAAVWSALTALTLAGVLLTALPVILLWPLVPQTPEFLRIAYLARTHARWIAAILVMLFAAIIYLSWPLPRRRMPVLALLVLLLAASGYIARTNVGELFFAPAPDRALLPAASYHDIADSDMVLGVVAGGEERAYPVRYMGFHHLVNDRLGGQPILPTY